MKKTLSFRILSLLFALVFLVTALPLGIFANDVETTAETTAANDGLTATVSEGVSLLPTGYEDEPTFPEEISELRTENVKHFDKGDGTYEAISYGGAVHRKDADGKWQDIDNTLTLREDRGAERYVDADARISFAPTASSGAALWQLSENGYSISLSLADAGLRSGAAADVENHASRAEQIVAAKKADDTDALFRVDNTTKILYRNVLANVDLEYILSGNDVKETILVQNVCENYDFPFRLSLSGLIPKATDDGAILLCDSESGKEVYLLPAPYMTDADDSYSDAVSYRLTDLGEGEYEIIVSASDEWINAPERAFPVAIDPTVTTNSSVWDSYTDASYPNSNYGSSNNLWVSDYCTTFIKIVLPTLPYGASLNTAKLYVSYFYNITDGSLVAEAHKVLGSWNQNQITYNNAPQIGSSSISSATLTASTSITSSTPGTAFFTLTSLVRSWYNNPNSDYGVAIKRASGDNLSVILKSFESNANFAYYSINYYPAATINSGIYQIKNVATGKYLTVTGQGTSSGTTTEQRTNSYGDHQQFLIKSVGNCEYTIQPIHATEMAISTQSSSNGSDVTLAVFDSTDSAQRFTISQCDSNSSQYVIKNKKSNFSHALSVNLGLPINGLKITQYSYSDSTWQKWVLEFAGPTSGVYALGEGNDSTVYMTSFARNTGYYLSSTDCEDEPPYISGARAGIFKLIYRPLTQDFIIRSMIDNATLIYPDTDYLAPLTHRLIGTADANVSALFTWSITKAGANKYYVWYKTSDNTILYLTMPDSGHPTLTTSKSSATKWQFSEYSTFLMGLEPYDVLDSQIISPGSTVNFSFVGSLTRYNFYSTIIGSNMPGFVNGYSVTNVSGTPTSVASISSNGILTADAQKMGVVRVTVSFSCGLGVSLNLYVSPGSGDFFFMQNIQSSIGYAEGNNSCATKTAFPTTPYSEGGSYNDTQLWEKIPSPWPGYYYIRNVGTGLYLSAPDSLTMDAELVMESSASSARQAWIFSQTTAGAWRIRTKRDATAGNNLYINVKSSNNKLIQGTYVQNSSYYDEFNVLKIGGDVVYNRTVTWGTTINPSEELIDLAKYYDTYTLIHTDIYMDINTAKSLLRNSKIMIFNGHGSPRNITIYEKPQSYLSNTDIYDPSNPDSSLDLSNTDIVFFAGCSTGGNACTYCDSLNNNNSNPRIDDHYSGCPFANTTVYNMPKSAVVAGSKVAIGWKVTQRGNESNEWIEYFLHLMNSRYGNTNELYTAGQAYSATNSHFASLDSSQSNLYGNLSFRLSD